jgi:hypothetical protein
MNRERLETQREALLRLLSDTDAATVALVKAQLVSGGADILDTLHALQHQAADPAQAHLKDVMNSITRREIDHRFSRMCREFGEDGPLEEACWDLAAVLRRGGRFLRQRETLDRWGEEVTDRVETLAEFLNLDQRLRGNDDDYYNLKNSLIPTVIDTRLGIPISLCLLYIFVGQRAGMEIEGIGLPGHFLVRYEGIFFDPFHGGQRVGLDDCKALLEQQNLVLLPQHLIAATPRQMFIRVLTNIYYIAEQTDPQLSAKISEWITAVRKS